MLLILKIIKIFKKYYQSIVVMWQHMFSVAVMCTVWRGELSRVEGNGGKCLVWIPVNFLITVAMENDGLGNLYIHTYIYIYIYIYLEANLL
jgi:hypothetical protein